MKRALVLVLFICAASLFAQTQQPVALTIDMIMKGPQFAGYEPRDLRWAPDGQHLFFRWKQYTEPIEKDYDTYVVNRDGKGLRKLSDEEAKDAPPVRAYWSRDHKRAVYVDDGDVVLYENNKHRKLTDTIDAESAARFTRDERHVAFMRGNNLYVVAIDDGAIVEMTNIAGPDDKEPLWDEKKGDESQEWVKSEERKLFDVVERRAKKKEEDEAKRKKDHPLKPYKIEKRQNVADLQLTPDGKYVIASINTEGDKAKRTIVANYVSESGYTEEITSREKVGDPLTVSKLVVLSTADGAAKTFESGLEPPEAPPAKNERTEKKETRSEAATAKKERDVAFGMIHFSDDGTKAFVALRARDNKDAWIMALDPATAKGRVLASMHDDAWVRRGLQSGWMPDNANVWFVSEQTGFAQLYEVPWSDAGRIAGATPKALTEGKWEIEDLRVSDDKKSFYLTTSEVSPFERHLYRMPLAGGTRTKLTSEPGRHDAEPSPDGAVIADLYSYTNKPPEVFVGTAKVTTSPSPEFFKYPWIDAPIVKYRATDGVEVPARVYKPAGWKTGGPAVVFVHGAGYLQNVHRWWSSYSREYMFHHFLMDHGYLVLDADYRGSAGYGRDWRTAIYRHMGGRDLADEVDGARWLEREYGVDSERIGMYGGSYGGFMTLMAMFTAPSAFRAGAALRPVSDWAHYNHGYTSDILNTPQTDPEAYRISSPIYFAEGLRGALLICHGVVDTNVHFQDTVRLVQKLIEIHAQNWDVQFYPVEDHGFVEPSSWSDEYKRIFRLFERELKKP
ncbi:MAG TPA: prolyl oligopeptidase family serine peptidase [Thermoanaerobaculia bacterium]|nr:prolyl oligopeptidase family serine peptidase [Thermoanaerobaculia bacterium]